MLGDHGDDSLRAHSLQTANDMKSIVGVDLHQRCAGALRVGAWYAAADELVLLHLVGEGFLHHSAAFHPVSEIMERERRAVETIVQQALGTVPSARIEVESAGEISDALVKAQGSADTLIIGRNAKRSGRSLIRLGATARRVLRRAHAPVIVVPPDLARVGEGPIMVAAACDDTGARALAFARKLAEAKGRSLAVVHAIEGPDGNVDGMTVHPQAVVDTYAAQQIESARICFEEWAKAQGLAPDAMHLLQDPESPTEQLISFASEHDVPLLVTAPHSRSYAQQVAGTSFSTELASYAQCPVAVV